MKNDWIPSQAGKQRAYIGLHHDGQLICSIVNTPAGWRCVGDLDDPPMLPAARAEVARKLKEMNGK